MSSGRSRPDILGDVQIEARLHSYLNATRSRALTERFYRASTESVLPAPEGRSVHRAAAGLNVSLHPHRLNRTSRNGWRSESRIRSPEGGGRCPGLVRMGHPGRGVYGGTVGRKARPQAIPRATRATGGGSHTC